MYFYINIYIYICIHIHIRILPIAHSQQPIATSYKILIALCNPCGPTLWTHHVSAGLRPSRTFSKRQGNSVRKPVQATSNPKAIQYQ